MSHDPSTPPAPPGAPDPDTHLLARRSVRWTIVGVVLSTVIALVSLYVQASQNEHDPDPVNGTLTGGPLGPGGNDTGGPGPGPDTPTPTPSPTPTPTPTPSDSESESTPDDGLTDAEHDLRDSLNSDQWSRESCTHAEWTGADAALYCTVTTVNQYGVSIVGKASVASYGTKYDRDAVFQDYAAQLQEGDCASQTDVYGTWSENNTAKAAGDVVCFQSTTGRYVFLCSYYDRPTLVQITGPDQQSLAAWFLTMEPVFSD